MPIYLKVNAIVNAMLSEQNALNIFYTWKEISDLLTTKEAFNDTSRLYL